MDATTSVIFPFPAGNSFLGQIWANKKKKKNQNYQFKMKFGT